MNSSRTIVAAALCAISAGIINVALAAPPTKNVNVVNTPDVNVVSMPPIDAQVTGTIDTNVVNTPDVNVVNTAGVNVMNTPGVTIENGPTDPVPVTTETWARVPFAAFTTITIPAQSRSGNFVISSGLPTSGVLVIEQVSTVGGAAIDAQVNEYGIIKTSNLQGSTVYNFKFPSARENIPGVNNIFNSSEAVRLYHDLSLGNAVVFIGRSPSTAPASFNVGVSGYIVPAGSPSLAP